jgi:hypothetical protein
VEVCNQAVQSRSSEFELAVFNIIAVFNKYERLPEPIDNHTDKIGDIQTIGYTDLLLKAQILKSQRSSIVKRIIETERNSTESATMHDSKDRTRFYRIIHAAPRVVKHRKNVKDVSVSEELINDRHRKCPQESLEYLLKNVTPDSTHPLIEPGPDVGNEIISDE